MILSINDRLELNIECITQLCGINVQKKNNIIQNMKWTKLKNQIRYFLRLMHIKKQKKN